jgi:hypothetical protein
MRSRSKLFDIVMLIEMHREFLSQIKSFYNRILLKYYMSEVNESHAVFIMSFLTRGNMIM